MQQFEDFLLEIGCEELPARDQPPLMEALRTLVARALDDAGIGYGTSQPYASPRRLALLIQRLATRSNPREVIRRGPPLERAYNPDGSPSAATLGFARSCGIEPEDLVVLDTEKGRFLAHRQTDEGQESARVLPDILPAALGKLPLRKGMRWGDGDDQFLRPVHWVLTSLGGRPLSFRAFGCDAIAHSYGHRVHHPGAVAISTPEQYAERLRTARIEPDWERRRTLIAEGTARLAAELDTIPVLPTALLDEITGLVEWPVVLAGAFEPRYLAIPPEVLSTVMIHHQRYIPLEKSRGRLDHHFLLVANLESQDVPAVIHGNARVLRARLADAEFFWNADRRVSLAERRPELDGVLFQEGLGSLLDKSGRLARVAPLLSPWFAADADAVRRAAELCKSDLLSGMVGEFPELQGVMGAYYALHDGEGDAVAAAIRGHYAPAGREDAIPSDPAAQCLSVADKLDTLTGFFALGQIPSGDKDPFALRRAALGVLRIALEGGLSIDLPVAIAAAIAAYGPTLPAVPEDLGPAVFAFLQERLRILLREEGFRPDLVDAVLARQPADPLDARARLEALSRFDQRPEAQALAAANKRIGNLLRKEGIRETGSVDEALFVEPAEQALWTEWQAMAAPVGELLTERRYGPALDLLAALRRPVDRFFDEVLVMADDAGLRANRLALIGTLRAAFLQVADLSLMQG